MELSHESWMRFALELADQAAAEDEVPIGAVLVHENKIIGFGYNRRENESRAIAHAEIMALEQYSENFAAWRLPAHTSLYVTAEPCLMCTGAMLQARVENIFYGCRDPKNAGLNSVLALIENGTFDHKFNEVLGGLLEDDAAGRLSSFFQKKRNGD